MKTLLLRFWHWLGRLLDQESTADRRPPTAAGRPPTGDTAPFARRETTGDGPPTIGGSPPTAQIPISTSQAPPAITLPPPLPPQMDLHTGDNARYTRKSSILTPREQRFYASLLLAVESKYAIMSKVRLWDFIRLENDPSERNRHLNRLSCRHVDFLLCEPRTLKPLLVIELDDNTHQTPYSQDSDRYKNELFQAVSLPIRRWTDSNIPPRRLREMIEEALDES